jgi:hypothetical protein
VDQEAEEVWAAEPQERPDDGFHDPDERRSPHSTMRGGPPRALAGSRPRRKKA